jgi:hypothetical protein
MFYDYLTVTVRNFGKILVVSCYEFAEAWNFYNADLTALMNSRFIWAG